MVFMMMRKKILYLITKGNWGGAQKYVYDLATNLPKDQYEAVVACGKGDDLPQKLQSTNIQVKKLDYSDRDIDYLADSKLPFELWQLLWQVRPDVVHLNSPKVSGWGALVARIYFLLTPNHYALPPKVIYTVHGFAFNEERPDWQKKIIKFLSWLTIIFCQRVIIINQREFDQVKDWPGVKNKLVLIKNGLKPISFLDRAQAREKLGLQPAGVVVSTIAELTKNKGLDYLAEAYPGSVVIGEGEERPNLDHKLDLLGTVPEAARYLKAFDIFVLPSRKEGLPYSILEAGLAGLPVVASDVGGIPEIIEDEKTGLLVPAGDIPRLKLAIEKLVANPNLRQKIGSALKQKIERGFSFSQMLEKTLELY